MTVADVFSIRGRGTVATGQVQEGAIRTGDTVTVNGRAVTVAGIEAFRKILDTATAGDNIGLLLRDLSKDDIRSGDLITGAGAGSPASPGAAAAEQDFPGGLPR